jgi:hypothetical protein
MDDPRAFVIALAGFIGGSFLYYLIFYWRQDREKLRQSRLPNEFAEINAILKQIQTIRPVPATEAVVQVAEEPPTIAQTIQ